VELPIARQSYLPTSDALLRAARRADAILRRAAAEEEQLESAAAFTQPARPGVRMLNGALDVRLPASTTAVQALEEIFDHFRSRGLTCYSLVPAEMEWPEAMADAAVNAGYRPRKVILYALERFCPPEKPNAALQVIPARAAYADLHRMNERRALADNLVDAALARQVADTRSDFLDEPRVDAFLGRLDQKAVGIVSVLTLGNIGVIEGAFTDHEYRGRGVASTLMTHAMEYCHRALFERVVIQVTEENPARRLLDALGFKPAASSTTYRLP
jgi:ribosomal protein S18 acetylase RimI-like enzyme